MKKEAGLSRLVDAGLISKDRYIGSLPSAATRRVDLHTSPLSLKSLYRDFNLVQSGIPSRWFWCHITISRLCSGGISGSGEEYTFQGQEVMTSLPLPRSSSWITWQSLPLDDLPPTFVFLESYGIRSGRVSQAKGPTCGHFLEVSIRWKCSRKCRAAFHLVDTESRRTGISLEWQAEELGLYSESGGNPGKFRAEERGDLICILVGSLWLPSREQTWCG